MTKEQFNLLERGDIIESYSGISYVVTAHYGDHVIAVRTVELTNPAEWMIVLKRNNQTITELEKLK